MLARAALNSPAPRFTVYRLIDTRGSAGSATGERKPLPTGNHSNFEAAAGAWAAARAGAAARSRRSVSFFILRAALHPAAFAFVYRPSGPFGGAVPVKSGPFMALIVQKFGGTSVGSTERIRNVARRVAKWRAAGHQIVVV